MQNIIKADRKNQLGRTKVLEEIEEIEENRCRSITPDADSSVHIC